MIPLTNNGVSGARLLVPQHVLLLLLPGGIGVREPEMIHFSWRVLPVQVDGDVCLAKNSDAVDGGDFWEVLDSKVEMRAQTWRLKALIKDPVITSTRWRIPFAVKCDLPEREGGGPLHVEIIFAP